MYGLGTIINTAGVILGGVAGALCGKALKQRHTDTLTMACGVSTLFIGITGALEGMLSVEGGSISSGHSMMLVLALTIGGLIGEIINIELGFERLGEWLKKKTGSESDKGFVNAFVTASLTVCIGAMAIVGSIQDGIYGDYSILATKAILDFVIITVMSCSLGKGAVFSALPILVLEGGMTMLASVIKPIMTDLAMSYLSLVGSVLIFCVGINLVWGKKVRVANLLPALVLAVVASLFPQIF